MDGLELEATSSSSSEVCEDSSINSSDSQSDEGTEESNNNLEEGSSSVENIPDLNAYYVEVHWDLSGFEVLVKYPDGYDQFSKQRFAISYKKPEQQLELLKNLSAQKPLTIRLSGGANMEDPHFLQFLSRFGKEVKYFTYICAFTCPVKIRSLVNVLTATIQNVEEVDFRQLFVDQTEVTRENEMEFLEQVDAGKKLRKVRRIILGEHTELTELVTNVIFMLMPNVEEIFDIPFVPLRLGFLTKDKRCCVKSVSAEWRREGSIGMDQLLRELASLAKEYPMLRRGGSPEVDEMKDLSCEDFNLNLYRESSVLSGIYQMFGL